MARGARDSARQWKNQEADMLAARILSQRDVIFTDSSASDRKPKGKVEEVGPDLPDRHNVLCLSQKRFAFNFEFNVQWTTTTQSRIAPPARGSCLSPPRS